MGFLSRFCLDSLVLDERNLRHHPSGIGSGTAGAPRQGDSRSPPAPGLAGRFWAHPQSYGAGTALGKPRTSRAPSHPSAGEREARGGPETAQLSAGMAGGGTQPSAPGQECQKCRTTHGSTARGGPATPCSRVPTEGGAVGLDPKSPALFAPLWKEHGKWVRTGLEKGEKPPLSAQGLGISGKLKPESSLPAAPPWCWCGVFPSSPPPQICSRLPPRILFKTQPQQLDAKG